MTLTNYSSDAFCCFDKGLLFLPSAAASVGPNPCPYKPVSHTKGTNGANGKGQVQWPSRNGFKPCGGGSHEPALHGLASEKHAGHVPDDELKGDLDRCFSHPPSLPRPEAGVK